MSSQEQTKFKVLAGLAGIFWLVAVTIGYFYTHKPFTPSLFINVILVGWRVAVAVSIVSMAGGLGRLIFPKGIDLNSLSLLALQAALGFGLLGIGILVLGAIIGFRSNFFVIVLVLLSTLLWKHWSGWYSRSIMYFLAWSVKAIRNKEISKGQ